MTLQYSKFWIPSSLQEVAFVATEAAKQNVEVHAIGSAWAFDELCQSANWGISLERLTADLTRSPNPDCVVNQATLLPQLWNDLQAGSRATVAQFQAGAKVFEVAQALQDRGYALPTTGGANGQTFIGAASTSTHGGDFELPPLPDLLRALHIVGPTGQEYWIESASRPVTDGRALSAALSCQDIRIVRDDDALRAAAVSFGRFGIVYSYVIDVVPFFWTFEASVRLPRVNVIPGLKTNGNPFSQWSGMIRANVTATKLTAAEKAIINARDADLVQIVTPSRKGSDCILTGRWHFQAKAADVVILNDGSGGPSGLQGTLCGLAGRATGIATVNAAFAAAIAAALLVPIAGAIAAVLLQAAQARWMANVTANPHTIVSGVEVLIAAVKECWDLPFVDQLIDMANEGLVLGSLGSSISEGRRGSHWKLTSGQPATTQAQCWRGDSQELIFASNSNGLVPFVQQILADGSNFRQLGYVSMRCCKPSAATLSMHNMSVGRLGQAPIPYVVSVEVASISDCSDYNSDYLKWFRSVQSKAMAFGGRPHWGQLHELRAGQVDDLYGEMIGKWAGALDRLKPTARTFSNTFTRARGFESQRPVEADGAIAYASQGTHRLQFKPRGSAPIDVGAVLDAAGRPSIATYANAQCIVAFRNAAGVLGIYDSATARLGTGGVAAQIMEATSPVIAVTQPGVLPQAAAVAYQATNGHLMFTPIGGPLFDTNLGMMQGTSPSMTTSIGHGVQGLPPYNLAFQANVNTLWIVRSNGVGADTHLRMDGASSPAICTLDNGSYLVAYHSDQGKLCLYVDKPGSVPFDTGIVVKPGTSPAIMAKQRGQFLAASHGADGALWLSDGSLGGSIKTGIAMVAGNSPSVCSLPGRFGVICVVVGDMIAVTDNGMRGAVRITSTLTATNSSPAIG